MAHITLENWVFDKKSDLKLRLSDLIPVIGLRNYNKRTSWPTLTYSSELRNKVVNKLATNSTILTLYNVILGVGVGFTALAYSLEKILK